VIQVAVAQSEERMSGFFHTNRLVNWIRA